MNHKMEEKRHAGHVGQTPKGHGHCSLTKAHDTTCGTAVHKRARVRGGVGRQATATWQLTAHGHSQREPAEAELVDRGAVACGAVERGAVERGDDERGAGERGACLWARRGAVRLSVIPSGIAPCRARRRAAGESRVRAGRAQRKERNRAHIVHAERSCARTFASLPNRSAAWP